MFIQLVSHAVRGALRRPGFFATIASVVALSLGPAAAAGNLFHEVFLRPLPFQRPDRLFVLSSSNPPEGWWEAPGSVAEFNRFERESRLAAAVSPFFEQQSLNFAADTPGAQTERFPVCFVEHDYFPLLGSAPAAGRTFAPDETKEGTAHALIVISHKFWQVKLGGRADVLGATLRFSNRPYTVIGVMPAGFRDTTLEAGDPDVWLPLPLAAAHLGADLYSNYSLRRCRALLRLNDGAGRAAAAQEADAIAKMLNQERPNDYRGRAFLVQPVRHYFFWKVNKPVSALFIGALLVLAVAAVNLANLLLVDGLRREQELAVRAALGADARRLGLTVLADALAPLLVGGAGAFVVATGLIALLRQAGVFVLPEFVHLEFSGAAMAGAFALLALVAAGAALAPVLRARRPELRSAMQSGGKGTGATGSAAGRNALIAAEVALATLLLFGTGLAAKSLLEMTRRPLGYNPDSLLTMRVLLDRTRLPTREARAEFSKRIHDAVQGGAAAAATIWTGSMLGAGGWVVDLTPGHLNPADPKDAKTFQRLGTAPGGLEILGIRLLRGRDFSPQATPDQPAEMVVDEQLGRTLWPGRDPIGQTAFISQNATRRAVVIGIVAPVRNRGREYDETQNSGDAYFSPYQQPMDEVNVMARVPKGQEAGVADFVRRQLARLDPTLAVFDLATMQARLDTEERTPRFTATILGLFAAISLLLTVLGVYGVLAFGIAQRTREFGVRTALGATRAAIVALVLGQGGRWVALGLFAGLVASVFLAPLLGTLLVGVSPRDPAVLACAAGVVLLSGLVATLLPAWRAARVDPLIALRSE
jgi:predicted permease